MLSTMRRSAAKRRKTDMIRLPADVALALRRRAAVGGVSIGEAARQLILSKALGGQHGLLEHLAWVHDRLVKDQLELEAVLGLGARDTNAVQAVIEAIDALRQEWATSGDDEDDDMLLYQQQGGF